MDDSVNDPSSDAEGAPAGDEIQATVERIRAASSTWSVPAGPLTVGELRWTPHLGTEGTPSVMHVHLSPSIPRHIARRLRAASATHAVFVALRLESLYDVDVLKALSDANASVLVLPERGELPDACHYLAALADWSVPVNGVLRMSLARTAWELRREGTSHHKGKLLEALLAFLLSQINGFRVFSRNFRAETEEIDIVVQVDALGNRCWNESGVPFVLVEAKNWQATVGSSVVSLLIRKLDTKRARARIGLLCATSGFSPEARDEELKEARGKSCVAFLGPEEIEGWIDAEDPDDFLDRLIGRAMLR